MIRLAPPPISRMGGGGDFTKSFTLSNTYLLFLCNLTHDTPFNHIITPDNERDILQSTPPHPLHRAETAEALGHVDKL